MQIPASRLDAYTSALNAQQQAAYTYMQTALRTFQQMNAAATVSDMREFAEQALYACVTQFGSQAAAVACSAYDTTMGELGFDVDAAEPSFSVDDKALSSSVDYFMRGQVDFDSFARSMAEKAYNDVAKAARQTTIANAERDYDHGVRYARVPTGKETCGFCLMLASRGFDYTSRESAGDRGFGFNRFHDRCDCRVVAGDAWTTVEGYDPDWLYSVYQDARSTVDTEGLRKSLREQGLDGSEINKRITNAISNEINRRDRSWAWSGEQPKATVADGVSPGKRITAAADTLASHGLQAEIAADNAVRINGMRWLVHGSEGSEGYGHVLMVDDGTEPLASLEASARELVDGGAAEALVIARDGGICRITR